MQSTNAMIAALNDVMVERCVFVNLHCIALNAKFNEKNDLSFQFVCILWIRLPSINKTCQITPETVILESSSHGCTMDDAALCIINYSALNQILQGTIVARWSINSDNFQRVMTFWLLPTWYLFLLNGLRNEILSRNGKLDLNKQRLNMKTSVFADLT